MAVIPVELAGRGYEVRVGNRLLADLAAQARPRVSNAATMSSRWAAAWSAT
jgi:3-dehydroquinate synthase